MFSMDDPLSIDWYDITKSEEIKSAYFDILWLEGYHIICSQGNTSGLLCSQARLYYHLV
jgi:hypothetical protein